MDFYTGSQLCKLPHEQLCSIAYSLNIDPKGIHRSLLIGQIERPLWDKFLKELKQDIKELRKKLKG